MNSLKTCRFCGKEFSRRLNCSLHENTCDENPLEIPRSTAVVQTGGGSDRRVVQGPEEERGAGGAAVDNNNERAPSRKGRGEEAQEGGQARL